MKVERQTKDSAHCLTLLIMDEKLYCHICKQFKEISQFSPCKRAKLRNGKSYVCKQCQALAQRRRREKQKDIDLLDLALF